MKGLQRIIDFFSRYTNNYSPEGIAKLAADIILVLVLGIILLVILSYRKKVDIKKIIVIGLVSVLLVSVCIVFELKFFTYFIEMLLATLAITFGVAYSQDLRHYLENSNNTSKQSKNISTAEEKKAVISTICSTAQHLAKRKVGALITIERNDSMDEYIQNAIDVRAVLTEEIMTTIFTPGTACHDGAIIVRNNIIMCAAAYFPSTSKYDVPKSLGSRHRAAIGISEHVDALTVVVSEQTGNISVTLDGIIYQNLSAEGLQEMLENHLLEQTE